MKHVWRQLIMLLLVAALLTGLCACGSSEPDPNAGMYKGVSAEMGGISIGLQELFGDDFAIELKDGGKAKFYYEGDDYSIKWSLDGTTFHAKGGGAELDGTLSDGTMVLENVMDSGVSITLQRD